MSRIEDILTLARDTLADSAAERWSDARLLRVLDHAHKDIAVKTRALRAKVNIPLVENQGEYSLPADCHMVSRVLFNGEKLDVRTHEQMDNVDTDWESLTGNALQYVVLDRQNRQRLKVYPIPDDLDSLYNYTVLIGGTTTTDLTDDLVAAYNLLVTNGATGLDLTEITSLAVSQNYYGVVTEWTDFTLDSTEGLLADSVDSELSLIDFDGIYGVVTDVVDLEGYLTVYYFKKPDTITTVTDELETDPIFDIAIKYYITSQVLSDDIDAKSATLAASEHARYERELREALRMDFRDSARTGSISSGYHNGFNNP